MTRYHSLSRRESWRRYVDAKPAARPERLTPAQLHALSDAARADYEKSRHEWHPNIPFIQTPQLARVHDCIEEIVNSNPSGPDKMRSVAAIDALPGLGKSTIATTYGRDFDREEIRRLGPLTDAGDDRIPVLRVALGASTTVKTLCEKICQFFAHPSAAKPLSTGKVPGGANADRLTSFALDSVIAAETKLAIFDDIHFINPRRKDGMDVTNFLKHLNSEFPVTLVFAGVQLWEKGFFAEGGPGGQAAAQTGRRWTRLEVPPFTIDTDEGRRDWHSLLKATEMLLVLAEARPGMLTRNADYIFARSTGHIGSYFSLISRACYQAIRTGEEAITRDLLEGVRIDESAERARRQLEAAIAAGVLTTNPAKARKPRASR